MYDGKTPLKLGEVEILKKANNSNHTFIAGMAIKLLSYHTVAPFKYQALIRCYVDGTTEKTFLFAFCCYLMSGKLPSTDSDASGLAISNTTTNQIVKLAYLSKDITPSNIPTLTNELPIQSIQNIALQDLNSYYKYIPKASINNFTQNGLKRLAVLTEVSL